MTGASAVDLCNNDYDTMFGMSIPNAVSCRWLTLVTPTTFSCGYMKTHFVRQMDELTISMLPVIVVLSLLLLLCSMGSKR